MTEIEREMLGKVRGRKALHLQCHFGLDTISLATLGGAVGLDFSEVAIAEARRLAEATGSAATFVCADVYETRQVVREQFDLVFSSFGAKADFVKPDVLAVDPLARNPRKARLANQEIGVPRVGGPPAVLACMGGGG